MKRLHRRDNLLLLGILVVAAALRFYHLDASSLWHDEGNTWALIQRSFAQIARDAAADIHPPGYYWLLKAWGAIFGAGAFAMRSFSATCGVLLVAVIYAIGKLTEANGRALPYFALLAAWVAAVNPFQIYYSQEARMYALLALESAGLFWALLALQQTERKSPAGRSFRAQWLNWPTVAYLLFGIAGLWTHYSFPIVLAAAGASYLVVWLLPPPAAEGTADSPDAQPGRHHRRPWDRLIHFALLNLLILVAYLPWLPTAVNRVLNWPKGGEAISASQAILRSLQTLLFGPMRPLPQPTWPWLLAAALLPVLGVIALRRYRPVVALTLWLLAPILVMFGLGLFSDAFLKFLLAASPAWCLLAGAMPYIVEGRRRTRVLLQAALVVGTIVAAAAVLPAYYVDANARDNYAGVAAYIEAVGDPAGDLVVLDAPGQQEVWSYYDPGMPVLSLPETRPADPEATAKTLSRATAQKQRLFALFWATDEADPDRLVESWLDQAAFKGPESWQGNLRFVTYVLPNEVACRAVEPAAAFGGLFLLEEICTEIGIEAVNAGEALSVGLRWQALAEISDRYKVSLQLLNGRGQVIAQHDAEPGGRPTWGWPVGERVTDNRALWIPAGTPPGDHRLVLAIYDAETGQRLSTSSGEAWESETIRVERTDGALPAEIVPMQHRANRTLGSVSLLGYDLHRKGFAHAPETPVQPGDLVELVVYWQAPDPLPPDWPADLTFALTLGEQEHIWPLAGGDYATGLWQAGELVRAVFEFTYGGERGRPHLAVDENSVALVPLPR